MNDKFREMEARIVSMLLEGDDRVLTNLRAQLQTVKEKQRSFTGVGFFTDFEVSDDAVRLEGLPSFCFGDVEAEMEGLQHGAGFLIFVKDGRLSVLEGFSYDEPWPSTIGEYKLSYSGKTRRDLAALLRTSGWPGYA
jgi:hypothetical protein